MVFFWKEILVGYVYRRYVCCSDYEERDAKCVACNVGFTSDMGKQCRPCSQHFYGYKCANDCHCNEQTHRCDHIDGCVVKEELPSTVHWKTDEAVSVVTVPSTFTEIDSKHGATDNNKEGTGISAINIAIYVGTVAVLIIFFGICHFCYRRQMISLLKQSTLRVEQIVAFNNHSESVEINEGVYHSIDNDYGILSLAEKQESPHFEVVSRSSTSGRRSDISDNVDSDNYLHSYLGFVRQEGDNHTYEGFEGMRGDNSDVENNIDGNCQIILQSFVKRTISTTDVIVHTFPGIASESDDEKRSTCSISYENAKGVGALEGMSGKDDKCYTDTEALTDKNVAEIM